MKLPLKDFDNFLLKYEEHSLFLIVIISVDCKVYSIAILSKSFFSVKKENFQKQTNKQRNKK